MVEIKEEDIVITGDGYTRFIKIKSYPFNELEQLKQQILQDHEDAKKWNKIIKAETWPNSSQLIKDRQIVKRLEERIKGCCLVDDDFFKEKNYSFNDIKEIFKTELQKILEGKE